MKQSVPKKTENADNTPGLVWPPNEPIVFKIDSSELHQIWAEHRTIIGVPKFLFKFRYESNSNANRGQISHFLSLCNLGESWSKCPSQFHEFRLTKPLIYSWRGAGCPLGNKSLGFTKAQHQNRRLYTLVGRFNNVTCWRRIGDVVSKAKASAYLCTVSFKFQLNNRTSKRQ